MKKKPMHNNVGETILAMSPLNGLQRGEASTTVWTNHGEPQPLDDKHFGVEVERCPKCKLELTHQRIDKRSAKPDWYFCPDCQEDFDVALQTEVEKGTTRQAEAIEPWTYKDAERELIRLNNLSIKLETHRDELLAACNAGLNALLAYGHESPATRQLRAAIANASK